MAYIGMSFDGTATNWTDGTFADTSGCYVIVGSSDDAVYEGAIEAVVEETESEETPRPRAFSSNRQRQRPTLSGHRRDRLRVKYHRKIPHPSASKG